MKLGTGVQHVVGLAGSGKTTAATRLLDKAEQDEGKRGAYYKMTAGHSWPEALQDIGRAITGREQAHFSSLGAVFDTIPLGEHAVVVLDDYRHHSPSAGPEELREQVAKHENHVLVVTFSLPHAMLPDPLRIEPLNSREWDDLGEWGHLTDGWPAAVQAMRAVIEESDDASIPDRFARRMNEVRADRLTARQKIGNMGGQYLRAMAQVGVPARVREVADLVGRSLTGLGPCRDALLRSGMIYMPKRGWVAFSCPFHQAWLRMEMRREVGAVGVGDDSSMDGGGEGAV